MVLLGGPESGSGLGSIGAEAGGENIIPIEELGGVRGRWRGGGISVDGEAKISGLAESRSRGKTADGGEERAGKVRSVGIIDGDGLGSLEKRWGIGFIDIGVGIMIVGCH